jgi:flagellar hook-associated protein 3 FlgL
MTSAMRVTNRSLGLRSLENLQGNLTKLGKLQEQLSSGKQISRPSDSPTGTVAALQFRGQLRQSEQYARNADDGLGWLGTIDTTLTNSLGSVNRARELTLNGMNTGAASQSARDALATEIDGLRESLVSMSNTTYLGRPVFGGTTNGSVAYQPDGTFVGDTNGVERTVGDNTSLRVDLSGPDVFGTGDDQLFAILTSISDNLRNNPAAVTADLGRLDGAMKNMQSQLADVGARYSRVEQARQAADDRKLTLTANLSEVESIDLPKTVMDLQMQEVAYQAALGATSRVIQPTLMDFLR